MNIVLLWIDIFPVVPVLISLEICNGGTLITNSVTSTSAMFAIFAFSVLLLARCSLSASTHRQASTPSPCRFSPLYSQDDILRNSTPFAWDVFYWEGQFHQDGIGYNAMNGMTYDGVLLNRTTGLASVSEMYSSSAASREVRYKAHVKWF